MCGIQIAMLARGSRNLSIQFKDMTYHKIEWVLLFCYISVFLYGIMFTILVAVSLLRKISYLHPNTKWRVLDGRVLRSIKMCQDNQYRSDLKANIIKSLSQNAVFAIS